MKRFGKRAKAFHESKRKCLKVVGVDEETTLDEYKYAIVMPQGDRNLDVIYRSEKPSRKWFA